MNARWYSARSLWVVLGFLVVLVVLPLLAAQGAEWMLHANGCTFDLKAETICVTGGTDWGPVLGRTFLWGRLVALGIGIWVTLLSAGIWLAINLWRRNRQGAAT